jgi:hypothetical protein
MDCCAGHIDRFASYADATNVLVEGWLAVCRKAYEEGMILELRKARRLGVKRLRNELRRLHGLTISPATIHKVRVRRELNAVPVRRRARATPPEETFWAPLKPTNAPLATPPDEMKATPPLLIVVLIAVPPERTISESPLDSTMPVLVWPALIT